MVGLLGCLSVAALISLCTGSVETPAFVVVRILMSNLTPFAGVIDERLAVVVWEIRFPRIMGAALTGAGLATAGACLQGLLRNPLADPGLIGVSGGGAVGAVLAISGLGGLSLGAGLSVPILAIAGALGTTFLVYKIASIGGRTHISTLLLGGLAINAMAGAIVGLTLYLSDTEAVRRFTFWTLGSLHTVGWGALVFLGPFTLLPLILLTGQGRALNAFTLGEAEAYHLGFQTARIKRTIIALSAAMVGTGVAFCGLIGFVGLVVPHLARLIWGPDFRTLIPASALLGSLLMVIADLVARTANAPSEIPVGILTALIGAPFFLGLVYRRKRQLGI